jgi:hypothetical protein
MQPIMVGLMYRTTASLTVDAIPFPVVMLMVEF